MAENFLVVSTYPPKGLLHGNIFSAVSHYTKSTLLSMGKNFSFKVLADRLEGQGEEYQEDNVQVIRCWQRGDPFLLFRLIKQLAGAKEKKILFCFEWGMFGRKISNLGFLPLFLLCLKILGKEIYFISHGVLLDYGEIAPQLGQKQKGLKIAIFNSCLKFLYSSIILFSKKLVVFEEYLRRELLKLAPGGSKKIVTIPHGVDEPAVVFDKLEARKRVGIKENEFALICFGFLVWYKGSDWLIETLKEYFQKNPGSKLKLLMVGGESQVHKNDPVYCRFLEEIYKISKESNGKIIITGFIPEEEIGLYFSAADLVIFPYRVLVSGSGPLSFVFTYKKPFLLSDRLGGYTLGQDFRESLAESGLSYKDISFSLENKELVERIEFYVNRKKSLEIVADFSKLLFEKRRWSEIGKKYRDLVGN